jgi:hypothetical protein
MTLDLESVPLIDNHCHPPYREPPADEQAYKRFFTESSDPRIALDHVQHTLFYQEGVRLLTSLLGEPEGTPVGALLERRSQLSTGDLLGLIVKRAGISGLVVDFGFPVDGVLTHDELKDVLDGSGCQVRKILRLEKLAEDLIPVSGTFDDLVAQYTTALLDLRGKGVAGLKTVIAYRSGLAIRRTAAKEAAEAFDRVRSQAAEDGGQVRLTSKPLLDFLLVLALEQAAVQQVPVQVHTALGDTDIDLLQANPLLLRPVLEDPAFRDVPIVLLHCYPYLREASYLSNMYGNLYFDLSMTIPLLSHTSARALEDALSMAPASKLLYGSDAPGLPDYLWFGAVVWRRTLGRLLGDWMENDGLPLAVAERVARQILYENAWGLYGFSV